ncbi:MAG: V-type ATP synthase subunit D [Candidatus Omnitrophica bacterium]|nr:V-type ATP synthase subunit D [Candidatus Omnitrophota bacterium]MCM8816450.1 V-type ATP synthase subunit D [Candidatus Omnitrophota bacterium]
MSITIAATKTNLLKTKRTLELCKEGYQLLDEKRKILLMEISSTTALVEKIQKETHNILEKVYEAFEKALFSMGKTKIESIIAGIDTRFYLDIGEKRTMGTIVPEISLRIDENLPFFSPIGISPNVDEVIFLIRQALEKIIKLAEKKNTLLRLEQEFNRTTKKVNALEKIHIPYYSELVRNITERLDEESREAFATLKEIKKRIA